mgnify:CR=1 FL=1
MNEADKPSPDELLRLKDNIKAQFDQLPSEHQASFGLVLAHQVLSGDMGVWFAEALNLTQPRDPLAVSMRVTRTALEDTSLAEDEIESLTDADLVQVSQTVRDHIIFDVLRDEYTHAVRELLDRKRALEGFGLTKQERLFYRVKHERFIGFLNAPHTSIHDAQVSTNNYGEFLFVTASRPGSEEREQLTFFGLGYHEPRDRWITDEWFWYQARPYSPEQKELEAQRVLRLIEDRQAAISTDVSLHRRSRKGIIFEQLADIGDDDSVIADFEDGLGDEIE